MRPSLMKLRITTSSRGFAAAAPRPAVKPASSMIFAISAVTRTCSSNGIIWMGANTGRICSSSDGDGHRSIPASGSHPARQSAAPHPLPPGISTAGTAHAFDAIALDNHLACVGRFAGGVENPDVGEGDGIVAKRAAFRHPNQYSWYRPWLFPSYPLRQINLRRVANRDVQRLQTAFPSSSSDRS